MWSGSYLPWKSGDQMYIYIHVRIISNENGPSINDIHFLAYLISQKIGRQSWISPKPKGNNFLQISFKKYIYWKSVDHLCQYSRIFLKSILFTYMVRNKKWTSFSDIFAYFKPSCQDFLKLLTEYIKIRFLSASLAC